MTRNKAGDETNRALVAYVRNLSDEELADLLAFVRSIDDATPTMPNATDAFIAP